MEPARIVNFGQFVEILYPWGQCECIRKNALGAPVHKDRKALGFQFVYEGLRMLLSHNGEDVFSHLPESTDEITLKLKSKDGIIWQIFVNDNETPALIAGVNEHGGSYPISVRYTIPAVKFAEMYDGGY